MEVLSNQYKNFISRQQPLKFLEPLKPSPILTLAGINKKASSSGLRPPWMLLICNIKTFKTSEASMCVL